MRPALPAYIILRTQHRRSSSCSKSGIPLIARNDAAGRRDIREPVYGKELKRRDNGELQNGTTTGFPYRGQKYTVSPTGETLHDAPLLSSCPPRTHATSPPRYGTETTLFVFKGIPSHSVRYVSFLKARCHFQEGSQSYDATVELYKLGVLEDHPVNRNDGSVMSDFNGIRQSMSTTSNWLRRR